MSDHATLRELHDRLQQAVAGDRDLDVAHAHRELATYYVQRGMVQQTLERHPLVEQFWDAAESHLGATVARLRPR